MVNKTKPKKKLEPKSNRGASTTKKETVCKGNVANKPKSSTERSRKCRQRKGAQKRMASMESTTEAKASSRKRKFTTYPDIHERQVFYIQEKM